MVQLPLIVCPACQYGFVDDGSPGEDYVCPRPECAYCWNAATETIAAIHGVQRRRAFPELIIESGASKALVVLAEGTTILGRDPGCQFRLDNLNVSRRHAQVVRQGDAVSIEDLGSAWGTLVGGQKIQGRTLLRPRDEIVVGGITIRFAVRFAPDLAAPEVVDNVALIERAEASAPVLSGRATEVIPVQGRRLTIGRGEDRDLILPDAMISRKHALIECRDGHYFLSDLQSRIGTYVNGKGIIRAKLDSGDRIQLGPYLFRFEGDQLTRVRQPTSWAVSAVRLRQAFGRVQLLDEISLVLQPGEFVGLLGPSGAGKTTLLDALNGLRPAKSGHVQINGEPLYEQYERLRHLIGYVPQEDIIHRELTCRQALTYAGRLRLPADVTSAELARLVNETLAALDLEPRADIVIAKLSGGQRKRASVGVELLSRPGILFLDEPTSGLDPSTESLLMRKFQQLAHQGRTVVCTTHVMENVDLFDKVAVLARGGKLAYFGPPIEAKGYFGIDKFTLLYEKLEEKSPDEWKQRYQHTSLNRNLLGAGAEDSARSQSRSGRPAPAPRSTSWLGQLAILTLRFLRILGADRMNLALMIAQPLVIAGLICLVCREMPTIFFLLVVTALWFGCSNAAQQIVKERPIYRRERMVNLGLFAYVFSKFLPLSVLAAMQCFIMLLLVWLFKGWGGSVLIQLAALGLASANGVAMGLIISALAANADKAMTVVPLTLIPQIILAGVLVALPDMNWPTRAASFLTVSCWTNQALEVGLLQGQTINKELLEEEANLLPLWNLYPDYKLRTQEGRIDFLKDNIDTKVDRLPYLVLDFGVLGVILTIQLAGVIVILRRQDVW